MYGVATYGGVMAFTAIHPDRGRLDATLDDLGCGWAWSAIHRARPRVPLICPECRHQVHPKFLSRTELRLFAHDAGAPQCGLAEESPEHHFLKLQLATAIRAAGAYAQLEARGPRADWRADVLATSADGTRRMAWEAQISPITPDVIRQRTARFAKDGVDVCWVAVKRHTWLGEAPSILAAPPGDTTSAWTVAGGLFRFDAEDGRWVTVSADLDSFVDWALSGRIGPRRFAPRFNDGQQLWTGAWTAPRYVDDARAHQERFGIAPERGRPSRRVLAGIRASGRVWLLPTAMRWVRATIDPGVPPTFEHDPSPRWAGGTPVRVGGVLVALLQPSEHRIDWTQIPVGLPILVDWPPARDALVATAPPAGTCIVVLGEYKG